MTPIHTKSVRPGFVAVLVALLLTVLMGFAALAVDTSMASEIRAELQAATDNCALATAAFIANHPEMAAAQLRTEAIRYGQDFMALNLVAGQSLQPEAIETGMVSFDENTGRYGGFASAAGGSLFNSVRVRSTVEIPTVFGGLLGVERFELGTLATAVLPSRDFVLVYDESGSMTYDSTLRHISFMRSQRENGDPDARINLRQVWASFSPAFGFPYDASAAQGMYHPGWDPLAAGPRFGTFMNLATIPDSGYGTSDDDMSNNLISYRPHEDPGLVYLPLGTWDAATLRKLGAVDAAGDPTGLWIDDRERSLRTRHIDAIALGSAEDLWRRRVGIALGLYQWTPANPHDDTIGDWSSGELSMLDPGGTRVEREVDNLYKFKWSDWFGRMDQFSGPYYGSKPHEDFVRTFGIKTLWNHMLMQRTTHAQTEQFSNSPQQPTESVRQAVADFFQELVTLNIGDRVALATYASEATALERWVDFRAPEDLEDLRNKLRSRQAGHLNLQTNTGEALEKAIDLLTKPEEWNFDLPPDGLDPRPNNVQQVIVLLTDGVANKDESGALDNNPDGLGAQYAVAQARRAADLGITIHTFTIGVKGDWQEECQGDTNLSMCGVGQVVANLTGGSATRIVGDFDLIRSRLTDMLASAVAPPNEDPILVE